MPRFCSKERITDVSFSQNGHSYVNNSDVICGSELMEFSGIGAGPTGRLRTCRPLRRADRGAVSADAGTTGGSTSGPRTRNGPESMLRPVPRGALRALMVGVTGFEPATSSSRTTRATKLRHTPRCLCCPQGATTRKNNPETASTRNRGSVLPAGRRPRGPSTRALCRGQGQQARLRAAGEAHWRVARGAQPGGDVEV